MLRAQQEWKRQERVVDYSKLRFSEGIRDQGAERNKKFESSSRSACAETEISHVESANIALWKNRGGSAQIIADR